MERVGVTQDFVGLSELNSSSAYLPGYLASQSYEMELHVLHMEKYTISRGGIHLSTLEPYLKFSLLNVPLPDVERRRPSDARTSTVKVGGVGDGIVQGEATLLSGSEEQRSQVLKNVHDGAVFNEVFRWKGLEFDSMIRVEVKHRQRNEKLSDVTVALLDMSVENLMQAVADGGDGEVVVLDLEGEKASVIMSVLLAFEPNVLGLLKEPVNGPGHLRTGGGQRKYLSVSHNSCSLLISPQPLYQRGAKTTDADKAGGAY